MSAALRRLGFAVTTELDADRIELTVARVHVPERGWDASPSFYAGSPTRIRRNPISSVRDPRRRSGEGDRLVTRRVFRCGTGGRGVRCRVHWSGCCLVDQRLHEHRGWVYTRRLLDRFRELPGVEAVGAISNLHLHPLNTSSSDFYVDRFEPPTDHGAFIADRAETSSTPGPAIRCRSTPEARADRRRPLHAGPLAGAASAGTIAPRRLLNSLG